MKEKAIKGLILTSLAIGGAAGLSYTIEGWGILQCRLFGGVSAIEISKAKLKIENDIQKGLNPDIGIVQDLIIPNPKCLIAVEEKPGLDSLSSHAERFKAAAGFWGKLVEKIEENDELSTLNPEDILKILEYHQERALTISGAEK